MTSELLKQNIEKLRKLIPAKPSVYTPDYPKNIEESFTKYLNTSTTNLLVATAVVHEEKNWLIPFYALDSKKKLRLKDKLLLGDYRKSPFIWITLPSFQNFNSIPKLTEKQFEESMIQLFEYHSQEVKQYFLNHPLLVNKDELIQTVFNCYRKKYWAASICTLFPLLDLVMRRFLRTTNLTKNVTHIISLFKKAGFDYEEIDNLKPGREVYKLIDKKNKTKDDWAVLDIVASIKSLGLSGIALSSFLIFANKYYGYYKEDENEDGILNRHAIIHCGTNNFWNKANTVRLIMFFDLTLRLEPIFKILFEDD